MTTSQPPSSLSQGETSVLAHAKLTMSLRITGIRDDGYHLIDAEMVSLDLADELAITPVESSRDASLTVDGQYARGIPTDSSNLVMKAMTLSGRYARVHITKNIPHGGGLGGGSSDAAAYLRAIGFADLHAASRIGADIPFCLGGGRARVQGIGEIIQPLTHIARDITLVIPPVQVPTPLAYSTWDALNGPHDSSTPLFNDLEAAALTVEPALATWKQRITDAAGAVPTLAGSGATWFLVGHYAEISSALPDASVVLTRTVQPTGL